MTPLNGFPDYDRVVANDSEVEEEADGGVRDLPPERENDRPGMIPVDLPEDEPDWDFIIDDDREQRSRRKR